MTESISKNEQRAIGFLLIGALLLRLYTLGSESLWLDEAIIWHRVKDGPLSFLFDWDADTQGPTYPLLIWFWSRLFGFGEIAMRVPSVIFGVLSIHAIYLLGRRMFNHSAAMWAAVFATINPFLLYYSQEARPYTLWLWASLLAIWYLVRLMERHSRVNERGWIILTLIALYTHPYGPFLLAMMLMMVVVLQPRADWKRFLKPATIIGVAYLPEAYVFLDTFLGKVENKWSVAAWISRPDFVTPWRYMKFYFSWELLAGIVTLLLIGGLVLYRKRVRGSRTGHVVCAAIIVGFFVLPWLVSQVAPILWMRYTITVVAALLLLLGWVVAQAKKPLQMLAVGLVLLASVSPLYHYYTETDKDPWRQAVAWLAPQVAAADQFIVHPKHAPLPLEYYLRDLYDHEVVVPLPKMPIEEAVPDTGDLWFVAATYSHSKLMRDSIYTELNRTCDCDSTYKTADIYTENPYRLFLANIEITKCRVRPVQTSRLPD